MNYQIMSETGEVINTIAADEKFVRQQFPGRWKKLAEPVLDAPPPRPRIVITALSAESPHDEQIMVAADYREATLPVGATLVVDAELHAGGAMLPLTDSFRMPLVSTDGRERVLLARIQDGRVTLRVPMTESRIWRITETQINSALPEAAHMAFDGLTLYVVEA